MTFNPTRKQLIVSLLRFVISILNYSSGSKYYSNYIFKTLIGQKRKKNPILFSFGDIVLVPYLDYMSIFHPMVKYSKFCSLSIIGNIITLSTLRAKKSPSAKPAWDSRDRSLVKSYLFHKWCRGVLLGILQTGYLGWLVVFSMK